jgi:hypothetical protein
MHNTAAGDEGGCKQEEIGNDKDNMAAVYVSSRRQQGIIPLCTWRLLGCRQQHHMQRYNCTACLSVSSCHCEQHTLAASNDMVHKSTLPKASYWLLLHALAS